MAEPNTDTPGSGPKGTISVIPRGGAALAGNGPDTNNSTSADDVRKLLKLPTPSSGPSYTSADDVRKAVKEAADAAPPADKTLSDRIVDNTNRMGIERNNNMLAGPQFTTPIVDAHKENYVGDAHIMDDNSVAYTNDEGKVVPTDKNKHVVLQDPEDGKYKVYNRTEKTDLGPVTGRLVALGHLAEDALSTVPISHGLQTILARPGMNIFGFGKGVSPEAGAATKGGSVLTAKGAAGPEMTEGAKTAETAARVKDNTGVNVAVPKVVASDNAGTDFAANNIAKLPISGAPIKSGVNTMGDNLAQAARGAAEAGTGDVVGAKTAGESIRGTSPVDGSSGTGLLGYTAPKGGILSNKIGDQYDKVGAALTKSNYEHQLGKTQKLADALTAKYTKAGLVDPGAFPDSVKEVLGPLSKPGGLNYNSIRFVRTKLGQLIGQPEKLPASVDVSELKQLYGALKEDTRDAVRIAGSSKADPRGAKAVGLLDRADKYAEAASRRRETLVRILGPDSRSDEGLFNAVADKATTGRKADIDALQTVKKSLMPHEWQDVSSAVIDRLGKTVTTHGEAFDPGKFVKDYTKISEAGKSVLFGDNTAARQALDDIAKLSSKWSDAAHLGHSSGTAGHLSEMGVAGAMLYGGHYLAQAIQAGHWEEPLMVLSGLTGGRMVASVMSSPVTARSAVDWARAYEALRLRPGSVTVAAFNNASRDLEEKAQRPK